MRRREFITRLGVAASIWPLAARGQQSGADPLIGILSPLSEGAVKGNIDAFRTGIREAGYVEGQNITIETRFADGAIARMPDLVSELVTLKPAVLVVGSPPAAVAAHNVTSTIPIVISSSENPIALGLARSLARPGGNVTGFWWDDEALTGKRFELLKEAVPGMTRVGIIVNPNDPTDIDALNSLPAITKGLGLTIRVIEVRATTDIEPAFATAVREQLQGLQIGLSPVFNGHRAVLATLAANARLPTINGFREFATAGGLMSYAASLPDIYRRLAGVADKILKGARPGELPVERPTKFELVINLTTAKVMGLTIPNSMRLLADEVIE
jgi:putative tryptophan/tyrosine transport system substrate-binding protein